MQSFLLFAAVLLSIALVSSGANIRSGNETLDCASFDPKKIKLITFDVFAALMDLDCK